MIKIAITGNIASGKSEAEKILKEIGYKVFDTDKIAHKMLDTHQNEVLKEFEKYDIIENSKISRIKLRNLIFNDDILKKTLENIIHPYIKEEINKIFNKYKNEKYIFISVPLLFECNMESMFDKIVLIYCDNNIRMERLMQRNNLEKDDTIKIMNSQLSQDEKIDKSNYIIYNNSTIFDLKKQIKTIF